MKHIALQKHDFVKHSNRLLLWFSGTVLVGAVFGVLSISCLNLTAKQALFSDLTSFLYTDHSNAATFLQSLWQISRIPLAVLLLGFTCFGVAGIPAAIFLQGYLLSFSVAAMVRLLGWRGLLVGVATFGIQATFLLPCLLILSVQCFSLSKQLFFTLIPLGKHAQNCRVLLPSGFLLAIFLSCVVLFIGATADFLLADHLISFVSGALIIS